MKTPTLKIKLPHLEAKRIRILSLGTVLSICFLTLLLLVGYLIYAKVYMSVFGQSEDVVPTNVVRVDLKNYQSTIELLNDLETYSPSIPETRNPNPFR